MRVVDFGIGRWLACADTPDGPNLAWDVSRIGAILAALEPFRDVVPELLENQRRR